MEKLLAAAAASGAALNNKFVEEFQGKEMCFGYTKDFFKGLDGMIGPPNPNLLEGMRWEHWERKDSHKPFTATNTHIETTSASEYSFVFEPDQLLRVPHLAKPRSRHPRRQLRLPLPRSSLPKDAEDEEEEVAFPPPLPPPPSPPLPHPTGSDTRRLPPRRPRSGRREPLARSIRRRKASCPSS